jgi:hypothetical protein
MLGIRRYPPGWRLREVASLLSVAALAADSANKRHKHCGCKCLLADSIGARAVREWRG